MNAWLFWGKNMKEIKKDAAKGRVLVIGIGFVIGVALLLAGGQGGESPEITDDNAEAYRISLESELEALCEALADGEVKVFLSLEGGYTYTYAPDGRGGIVTVGSGSSEKAIIEGSFAPKVSGVGVVYFGAKSPALEGELTELVSSALGVGKNKIFIIASKKMQG